MSDILGGKAGPGAGQAREIGSAATKSQAEQDELERRNRERRAEENKRERARQAIITTRAQRPGRSILTQRPVNSILGS